ncbi:MAG: hypothetical protein E7022_04330 [Desulfovibrio desulfuricans]|nr:hypothetical protein [Desulfovibrio desulfuricans]
MMLTNQNIANDNFKFNVIHGDSKLNVKQNFQVRLQQATHGLRVYGFDFNRKDIADIACVSERTTYTYRKQIEKWWNEEFAITPEIEAFFEEQVLSMAVKYYSGHEKFFEGIFSALLGISLKSKGFLANCTSLKSLLTAARHLTNVYGRVITKDGKGVCLSANSIDAKAVLRLGEAEVNQLFERSKRYKANRYSKEWKPTERMNGFVKGTLNNFLGWLACTDVFRSVCTLTSYVAINASKSADIYNNYISNDKYIEINIETLKGFSFKSIFLLITKAIGYIDHKIIIPIQHEAHTNEEWGRTYNVFCRIQGKERKQLGYIGYDMNAGLQSICLNLIGAKENDFPLLFRYAYDSDFKKKFRKKLANELGKTIDAVKSKLTAFANGLVDKKCNNNSLKQFQDESDLLRREVMRYVSENTPDVLERALVQSRRELPDELDWADISSEETIRLKKDKASVFFFVWTWFERLIRKAMLTVLPDGIEVHDAVYSKKDIDTNVVEDAVFKETGFRVLIGKEY